MTLGRLGIVSLVSAGLLAAPLRAGAAAMEPLPPTVNGPSSVGSLTYVKDLDHLAVLVSSDDALHARTLAINRKIKVGGGVLMGSAALGALMIVSALTVFQHQSCLDGANTVCSNRPNGVVFGVGLGTFVLGGLTGLLMMPTRGDLLDVVNEWNARHAERTLLLDDPHRH